MPPRLRVRQASPDVAALGVVAFLIADGEDGVHVSDPDARREARYAAADAVLAEWQHGPGVPVADELAARRARRAQEPTPHRFTGALAGVGLVVGAHLLRPSYLASALAGG